MVARQARLLVIGVDLDRPAMARHGAGLGRFLDGLDGHAGLVRTIGVLPPEGMSPATATIGLDVLVPDEAAAEAVIAAWHEGAEDTAPGRLRVASGPFAERLLASFDRRGATRGSDRFGMRLGETWPEP